MTFKRCVELVTDMIMDIGIVVGYLVIFVCVVFIFTLSFIMQPVLLIPFGILAFAVGVGAANKWSKR